MMSKAALWFKFRWPWLIPLGVSLLITSIWLYESFVYDADRMTAPVTLEHPDIKDVQISIQYPTSLSLDDAGKNAKQITIFSQSDANPLLDSVSIYFKAPIGVISFLDKDGNTRSSLVRISIKRGSVPERVWLEPSNTALSSSIREAHIETSVIYSQTPGDDGSRIPSLDLNIELEPRWRQSIRRIARSGLGTIAPLSLVGVLLAFSARTFLSHKRIQPKYLDMKNSMSSNRWDRAAAKCKEILEIDPIYDDIQTIYREIQEKEENQNKRLSDLYAQAKGLYASRKWSEAKRLLEEIRREKYDYNNEILNLLAEIEGKLNEEKQLGELYRSAVKAELENDIQGAIKYLRQIIAINPDYEDAQARLNKLESHLLKRISSDPAFMRMLLAKPEIGMQYIASFMDASAEVISERLLRLTHDENVIVRRNAAKVASWMKSPVAKTALYNLREDRDEQVRAIAAKGLEQERSVSDLIEELSDPDKWQDAGEKLIELGDEAIQPLISTLKERWPIWERAASILQAMRDVAQIELNEALYSDDPLIRERVSSILSSESNENG